MGYIDSFPWEELSEVCRPLIARHIPCAGDGPAVSTIMSADEDHLVRTRDDDRISGYYLLDDYPGEDIRPILERIPALIHQSDRLAPFHRPTPCGFGGLLDYRLSPLQRKLVLDRSYFGLALTNFSASACDMVGLYPYGESFDKDPNLIDWSMSRLLPYMLEALRKRGWSAAREPLIGIPRAFASAHDVRTFSFVEPRTTDIEMQSAAYCRAGASALVYYAWQDRSAAVVHDPANTLSIRDGMRLGMAAGDRMWHLPTS